MTLIPNPILFNYFTYDNTDEALFFKSNDGMYWKNNNKMHFANMLSMRFFHMISRKGKKKSNSHGHKLVK